MIKAIIFDWYRVLVLGNWSSKLGAGIASKTNIDADFIVKTFKEGLYSEFCSGKISGEEFLEKFIPELKIDAQASDFKFVFNKKPDINQDFMSYIKTLSIPKYILSGNYKPVFENYKKEINLDFFDDIFTSYDLGMLKTNPEIWDSVLNKLPFSPEEIIFVDDQDKYLDVAKEKGLNIVKFNSTKQAIEEISNLLK